MAGSQIRGEAGLYAGYEGRDRRMSVPLATLRRHGQLVWMHDAIGLPPPLAPGKTPPAFTPTTQLDVTRGKRLSFWSADEATAYLRYWKGDVASVMAVRSALQKSEPSAPVFSWNDDEVLEKFAARIARGAVVATEGQQAPARAVMPATPVPPVAAEPPAVPVAQLLAPVPLPAPPLLPLLEELQMEGAEVLPEIEQSLEQVELTLGEIKLAPVSLEPTPSKVPGIKTAMTEASDSVTTTLDGL